MYTISESDWKIFRGKIGDWQEHYMERLLKEYVAFLRTDGQASDKFWSLEKRIRKDKKCPGVLIEDMKRSTAVLNIVALVGEGVIGIEELDDFSEELRETVKFLASRLY